MKYIFKEIFDKQVWNNFLESYPTLQNGVPRITFVQSYQWLEFQKSLERRTLSLGIFDSNDTLIGLAAGVFINAKRGNYLYIRNGPVLDWENKELVSETIGQLKSIASENDCWFVRISPLVERESVGESVISSMNLVDCPMHDVEALDTWVMNIEKEEEELLTEAKKKNRYLIRKSLKPEPEGFGLEAVVSNDINDIDRFYTILQDTVSRQNWNAYSKEYIKAEFDAFSKDGHASLILVTKDNKDIATGIFIHFANQTFYHYGASLTEFNNIPGPYRVIWEAIREGKNRGNRFMNFWGIAPENKKNHPWQGLTSFKKKFPGFEQRWTHSKDIPVSTKYWVTNLIERYDKMRKGY